MNLRKYQKEDAYKILSWFENEKEFRFWSANYYQQYPIDPTDINNLYNECGKQFEFYPMMLEDDGKTIGHFIIKTPYEDKTIVQIGFVIVNNQLRGYGYGKKMLQQAIMYAKEKMNAKEVRIKVFENNDRAVHCYQSVGFQKAAVEENACQFHGENWNRVEMSIEIQGLC